MARFLVSSSVFFFCSSERAKNSSSESSQTGMVSIMLRELPRRKPLDPTKLERRKLSDGSHAATVSEWFDSRRLSKEAAWGILRLFAPPCRTVFGIDKAALDSSSIQQIC